MVGPSPRTPVSLISSSAELPPAPMAEDALRDNIKRLAEIETEMEELSKMERFYAKLSDLEVAVQKLADQSKVFVREVDLREVRKEVEALREARGTLERGIQLTEQRTGDQLARLAQVDAEIIRDLEKVERVFEKVTDVAGAVDKLANSGFVTQRALDEVRGEVDLRLEEARRRMESRLVAQDLALKKLMDTQEDMVKRTEFAGALDQLRGLREAAGSLDKSMRSQGDLLRESVGRLSEVDAKIIEDLSKMERLLERINDLERGQKRLGELLKTLVSPKELADARASMEERLERLEQNNPRLTALEAGLKEFQMSLGAMPRREEVDALREALRGLQALDVPGLLSKRDQREEGMVRDIERLSRVDSEIIKEMARLSKVFMRINDLEVGLRKLTDLSETFVRRPELELLSPDRLDQFRTGLKALLEGAVPPGASAPGKPGASPREAPADKPGALAGERAGLVEMVESLRQEHREGAISRDAYREALEASLRRMEELDRHLREAGAPPGDDRLARLRKELAELDSGSRKK